MTSMLGRSPRRLGAARHRRVDRTRRDGVDGDAVRPELDGERLREADHAALRRDVVRHARARPTARSTTRSSRCGPNRAASMSGIAAWRQWNVPVRFTAIMRSHVSARDVGERRELVEPGARHHDLDRPELVAHARRSRRRRPRGRRRRPAAAIACAPVPRRSVGRSLGGLAVEVEERDPVPVAPRGAGRSPGPCRRRRR